MEKRSIEWRAYLYFFYLRIPLMCVTATSLISGTNDVLNGVAPSPSTTLFVPPQHECLDHRGTPVLMRSSTGERDGLLHQPTC